MNFLRTAIRLTLVLAAVGGGLAGVLITTGSFWKTNFDDPCALVLLWFSLLLYSAITITGLVFVTNG